MDEHEFKARTKWAGRRIIRLVESLPNTRTAEVIGRQLLRCGTSVGTNYRSAAAHLSQGVNARNEFATR